MACAQKSAVEYLRNTRRKLMAHLQNFPLITESLYQQEVFNEHEVDALKAERTEFDKARCILDWVTNKGEMASYELLKILDVTRKRTLHSDLHYWISCFPFREDANVNYSFGTKPCGNYQTQLKMKAKSILKSQWVQLNISKYPQNRLHCKTEEHFHFIPLVLETDSMVETPQCKMQMKSKKCKKLRPKKLRAYIPNEEQALSPADLLKSKDKNILLIGKPGIGKTTFVQQILHLWTEKDEREPEYMFYFDDSILSCSSNIVNLESLLFDMYLKPKEKDRKEVFQDIEENSENVIIIIDDMKDVEENSVLKKILDHGLLPEAKVIITCRSEVEDEPLFSDWPTCKMYVLGFSEESIRTYYQKMLGDDSDLLDVVLNNQDLFSLSHVPMYAFMVVISIASTKDKALSHSNTVTEMYIHIFRHALRKHGKKTIRQLDPYLKRIKDHLFSLMKNAFNATIQKTLNLPDTNSDESDIFSVFLKNITIRESLTSAKTYCAFLHNTMQEFFSALWLLGNPGEIEKVLQLCQTEENTHMKHVLPFLSGLLGEHNIKLLKCLFPEDQMKKTSDWFIEKLVDTFLQSQSESDEGDVLFVCQCLFELHSPKACLMFLEKMDNQLDPQVDLDPHQCCALAYVISQSQDKEVYLSLENCTISDFGINMILTCSPQFRLQLWIEPLKQITFLMEFFHRASQCRQKNDGILTSQCCSTSVTPSCSNTLDLTDALLNLYSHVKDFETQTGRSFLPALQAVFQSAPEAPFSQRKNSVLPDMLKLHTEKKAVELTEDGSGWLPSCPATSRFVRSPLEFI